MTGEAQDAKAESKIEFTDEQQKLVNKRIGEARVKAREKAEADFKAQQAIDTEAAEQAGLVAKQEWQKLATKHEARVKELEPLEAQLKAHQETVAELLKDRVKALGDAAKQAVGALPKALGPLEKLKWLTANEGLFKETQAPAAALGTPAKKLKALATGKTPAEQGHRRLRL